MALLSELVAICEAHKVDSGATLNIFARRLREAGRVSKAGRGRGAAHMSTLDAARFLIACAATDHPERAADAEFVFSNLVRGSELSTGVDISISEAEGPTLDLALARVLELVGTGQLDEIEKVEHERRFPGIPRGMDLPVWLILRRSSVGANLRVLGAHYSYDHPALAALSTSIHRGAGFQENLRAAEALERETHRFRTGKNLSAELKLPLLRAVANLVCGSNRAA